MQFKSFESCVDVNQIFINFGLIPIPSQAIARVKITKTNNRHKKVQIIKLTCISVSSE